ncbi:unnamed protein product [Candida verbasci]|uniref:Cullin family profile domain-containing protein n=1 Tax=Candida verbasci TaxID=1227364 RepID=A0A9W4XAA3_9ASCO|nr:unnamed protein product [Candida verbasci]
MNQIETIINFNDLNNLENLEIDNDIAILLSWLGSLDVNNKNNHITEPSQRIKFAIRTCLKDEINQIDFMKLYINTIQNEVDIYFKRHRSQSIVEYISCFKFIINHYSKIFNYLNLNDEIRKLNEDKISLLIKFNLSDNFTILMNEFFQSHLFQNSLVAPTNLNTLNLIDIISTLITINLGIELNEIIIKLATNKIKNYTRNLSTFIWDKPLLDKLLIFIQNEVYPDFIITNNFVNNQNFTNDKYLNELIKISNDELIEIRIDEIYKIIENFPNSKTALVELHNCLGANNSSTQRSKLTNQFISYCKSNLLHAGVETVEVITMYTKTINAFLIIDPKGVLLDKVIRPIRTYLKARSDIIIKLVHGLLDTSPLTNPLFELAQDLRNPKNSKKMININDNQDLNWQPDPIDALRDFKKEKIEDTIESLISIFESKEIFIDEFTKLFSEKLIKFEQPLDELEMNLNYLKLKFGSTDFINLDIMIKDIKDSGKLNSSKNNFQSIVLSHLYWSNILENDINNFKVPKIIEDEFEKFNSNFKLQKQGRFLKLIPNLGLVNLEIEINGEIKSFEVSPDKVSIVYLFNESENELSVDYICQTLNMNEYVVQKGLEFWKNQGVLLELTKNLYIAND